MFLLFIINYLSAAATSFCPVDWDIVLDGGGNTCGFTFVFGSKDDRKDDFTGTGAFVTGAFEAVDVSGTGTDASDSGTGASDSGTGTGASGSGTFVTGLKCAGSCNFLSNLFSKFLSWSEKIDGLLETIWSKSLNDSFSSFQYLSIIFGSSAAEISDFGYVKG